MAHVTHAARALIVTALEMIEFLRIIAAAAHNGFVLSWYIHVSVNKYYPRETL